jgi:hypothetical protein
MKAAAAYMRGFEPAAAHLPVDPPLIEAVDVDGNLGYRFFLQKQRGVAVIGGPELDRERRRHLRAQGVSAATATSPTGDERRYEMLVLLSPSDAVLSLIDRERTDFPLRVIEASREGARAWYGYAREEMVTTAAVTGATESLLAALAGGDGAAVIRFAWELWIAVMNLGPLSRLRIDPDDQTMGREFARQWGLQWKESAAGQLVYYRHQAEEAMGRAARFYENYLFGDPMQFILAHPPENVHRRETTKLRLVEAASLPILIVDERIQDAAATQTAELWKNTTASGPPVTTPLGEALALSGTYAIPLPLSDAMPASSRVDTAPGLGVDLEKMSRESKYPLQSAVDAAARAIAHKTGRLPLLVIHQGLLDTSGLADAAASKAWVDSLIGERRKPLVADVIVTSGRGVPENLPDQTRYVPLSSLLTYATQRRSKYHLVQLLMSVRRKAHNV